MMLVIACFLSSLFLEDERSKHGRQGKWLLKNDVKGKGAHWVEQERVKKNGISSLSPSGNKLMRFAVQYCIA